MQIKTDNKFKCFNYRHEVPAKVLEDQFDYLTDDDGDGYFNYNGTWYHTSDFLRVKDPDLKEWDGIHSLYAFKAILIKISDCGDSYKVATLTC